MATNAMQRLEELDREALSCGWLKDLIRPGQLTDCAEPAT